LLKQRIPKFNLALEYNGVPKRQTVSLTHQVVSHWISLLWPQ
jgi:hypothetical protein